MHIHTVCIWILHVCTAVINVGEEDVEIETDGPITLLRE